jgi:hypothetical protein
MLRQTIIEAERFVGFDASDVVFKFTQGKHTRGTTYEQNYVRVVLPVSRRGWHALDEIVDGEETYVRRLYELFVHEVVHVVDYQNGVSDMYMVSHRSSEKRAEIVAMDAYDEFERLGREREPWVIELAEWIRSKSAKNSVLSKPRGI